MVLRPSSGRSSGCPRSDRFQQPRCGVGQVVDLSAGEGGHLLGQFTHLMAFGHLVEDLHALLVPEVLQRQLDAATESRMWMKARVWPPVP